MDIILLEHIEKVGDKHDVVKVKDGYGRNFLIPRGMAIVANKSNMARLDGLKKQASKKESAMIGTYQEMAAKLVAKTLKIVAKAGESGRLFGSVTAQNLVDAIKEQVGVTIEKRIVEMPEEVKELGSYEALVKFHPEVIAKVKFDVVTDLVSDTTTPVVADTVPVTDAPVSE
ncbi:MAG: 50S ribosomal protein L9 [Lewinellaceae bacterium]|nr:50S ribosomal protein L9 [Lewinellaceae bacterium]